MTEAFQGKICLFHHEVEWINLNHNNNWIEEQFWTELQNIIIMFHKYIVLEQDSLSYL